MTEAATERCSLEISGAKFEKYKGWQLRFLAKYFKNTCKEFIFSKDIDLKHLFFSRILTTFQENLYQGAPFSGCFRIDLFVALAIRCCRGLRYAPENTYSWRECKTRVNVWKQGVKIKKNDEKCLNKKDATSNKGNYLIRSFNARFTQSTKLTPITKSNQEHLKMKMEEIIKNPTYQSDSSVKVITLSTSFASMSLHFKSIRIFLSTLL